MLHHTVIRRALRTAVRDRLVPVNVAADLDGRPRRARGRSEDARAHCWTGAEAQTFLAAAKAAGPQNAAFYALALDSGARKGELCGLAWVDVDLDDGKIHVVRQLTKPGGAPTFGPPKGKRSRTVTLSAQTVALLKAHKQHQSALKMRNRTTYHNFGLAFAKEWGELRTRKDLLGQPLQANNLARSFDPLIQVAGIRRIKFHGLRHTCATLLLLGGEPVHVVAQRLGHADVQTTLNTYAHALPDAQQGAADRLAAVLHRR
jgi:integrase